MKSLLQSQMNRRTVMIGVTVTMPSMLTGCLDGTVGNDPARPDPAAISIDGRLHNETTQSHTFSVKAVNEGGYVLVDDDFEVPRGGTERIPAIGVPSATQTFTVRVDGVEHTETLTLDIEPADHVVDGFVDIRYTAGGEIELAVTPRAEATNPDSQPTLTGFAVSDSVNEPDVERESDMDSWGALIASRDVATEYFDPSTGDDAVQTFISETAFDAGDRLVYIQAFAPQTCYKLVLREDPYVDAEGVPVVDTVLRKIESTDVACGEALTPVDMLIRLSFDPESPPGDVVEVKVTDADGTQQEGFQLEAEM